MRRRSVRILVISAVAVLGAGVMSPATAAADMACSEPTRAVCATSDAGTDISKDRDRDYTTATKSENVRGFWAVSNQTDQGQTVNVRLVLDGPGTSHDQTLIGGWVLAPGEIRQGTIALFKVHPKDTPTGAYTWTVTGNGAESVTVSSTVTVY